MMGKCAAWVCAWLCMWALAGCSGTAKGNTLVENASPNTSALALYVYDGETVTAGYLYDSIAEKRILDEISSVNVKKVNGWSPKQVTLPVYGLEIGGLDGQGIQAAWSNGYWIAQDGTAWQFDYDFGALETDGGWTDERVWETASVLPCARILSQDGDGWNPLMLSPAGELSPPEDITMELVRQTDDTLEVELSNGGSGEWLYGVAFSIHVRLEGTWYIVPVTPGEWGFVAIGKILPAGETREETYKLIMYGELPAGEYRLVVEGMTAGFEV